MFAEIFKQRRQELNLTQQAVADTLQVSRQTVSNWENGKNFPDIPTLVEISEQYQLSLDYLLKGDPTYMKKVAEDYQMIQRTTKKKDYVRATLILMLLLVVGTVVGGFFFDETKYEKWLTFSILLLCLPFLFTSYQVYKYSLPKESSSQLLIPKFYGIGLTINPYHPVGKLLWWVIGGFILGLGVYLFLTGG